MPAAAPAIAFAVPESPRARARPFVKWAGGKGQLIPQLEPFFPSSFGRYFEPFLGGGAVFFHLQPGRAVLGDSNEELVNCFRVVRDHLARLVARLDGHVHDRDYYYRLRGLKPADPVERASRFLYLNKTCYNGLYRVNRQDDFNVPFGSYKVMPKLYDLENLQAASALLRHAELRCQSYEEALATAGAGDFVYLDPPYHPLSATARFTSYTRDSFAEADQERLAEVVADLDRRGCRVLLNNSDTPLIRRLYRRYRLVEAHGRRAINCQAEKRQGAVELIVVNY